MFVLGLNSVERFAQKSSKVTKKNQDMQYRRNLLFLTMTNQMGRAFAALPIRYKQ